MRAQIRVANDGDVRLEVESATETEADLLHLMRHQLSGRGLYLYSSGLGADLTLQIAAKPAAPQVERRYVPPGRDGVGSYSVTPQEVTATLRPGPDGVPLTVEPETVIPGQPIQPGVIRTQAAEPEPLDLWPVIKAGSRVRLYPTGKPGVITRVHCEEGVATLTIDFGWDAKAGAPAPASCKVPAGTTAEAIVRSLAASDPNFRGHDPEHECSLCGVLGARTPEAHKASCPWRMARAWVA